MMKLLGEISRGGVAGDFVMLHPLCCPNEGEVGRSVLFFLAFVHHFLSFLDQTHHALARLDARLRPVGKAHSQQMDSETRIKWQNDLRRNRSTSLDAPTWLWKSIVDLLAEHERAYLEHCRKYALEADK